MSYPKFSVLMTIYKNDIVADLKDAIDSVINQTIVPNEILIVKDGPLKEQTEKMLSSYTSDIFTFVQLPKNIGQSMALNRGILECKYDLVARMDADDISHTERFEKQLKEFIRDPQLDLVGTGILEFTHSVEDADCERVVPETHDEILKYSKFRSPVNHATVMYRKSKVIEAGNYTDIFSVADYHLWPRMFRVGSMFYNIQEPLLYVRGGKEMYSRRGGAHYAFQDLKLQWFFLKTGHVNIFQYLFNVFTRIPIGLSPNVFRSFVYRKVLRRHSALKSKPLQI